MLYVGHSTPNKKLKPCCQKKSKMTNPSIQAMKTLDHLKSVTLGRKLLEFMILPSGQDVSKITQRTSGSF